MIKEWCRHGRRGFCRQCGRERVDDLCEAAAWIRSWEKPNPGDAGVKVASRSLVSIHVQLIEALGLVNPRWQARLYEDALMRVIR